MAMPMEPMLADLLLFSWSPSHLQSLMFVFCVSSHRKGMCWKKEREEKSKKSVSALCTASFSDFDCSLYHSLSDDL